TVEIYDPTTNSWSTGAPMPTARTGLVAAAVNGKVYAIGGLVNGPLFTGAPTVCSIYYYVCYTFTMLNTLEIYDPVTNTWTAGAPMPTARGNLAAAVVNGKIYAIGGSGTYTDFQAGTNVVATFDALATVEAYDPATDTWSSAPLGPGGTGLAAAAVNGKIYAI